MDPYKSVKSGTLPAPNITNTTTGKNFMNSNINTNASMLPNLLNNNNLSNPTSNHNKNVNNPYKGLLTTMVNYGQIKANNNNNTLNYPTKVNSYNSDTSNLDNASVAVAVGHNRTASAGNGQLYHHQKNQQPMPSSNDKSNPEGVWV